jgi:hypothetical protein
MAGDRGAWDEMLYPALHARDIADETYVHHNDPSNPAPRRLDQLSDVDLDGLVDGDGLVWDDDAGMWVPEALATAADLTTHEGESNPHGTALVDLTDVDATALADGLAPVYNASTSKFEMQEAGGSDDDARKLIWMGW